MPVAILAMGIPGSGKTTLLKPLARKYGLVYVNRDDLRQELLGDATDQSRNKEVWEEAERRVAAALKSGMSVLCDSTFVEAWKRRDTITRARAAGAQRAVGVLFTTPLEVALARNAARDRVVPNEVVSWMHKQLTETPPSLAEGFDALYTDTQLTQLAERELRTERNR